MKKQLLIYLLVCFNSTEYVQAQWTKKDSIWLAGLLSGKDTIRLNPEFQKAIQSGTLINNDKPATQMRMAPSSLPFTRDFSEYIHIEDSTKQNKVALKDLPVAVFMRYGLDRPLLYKGVHNGAYRLSPDIKKWATRPSGTSFDNLLRSAFSPTYREQQENRERTTWKTYNDLPTPDTHRKQRKFRREHPEALMPSAATKDSLLTLPVEP